MNPVQIFIPILAIVGLAVVAPAWMHFLGFFSDTPSHIQFLAGLVLPILVLLLGASWLEPRGGA